VGAVSFFAADTGDITDPLIAVFDVCDKQTLSARGGDEPEQIFQNFTFGEIHQRLLPISGYGFICYALKHRQRFCALEHDPRAAKGESNTEHGLHGLAAFQHGVVHI
jgi:hypothetical protein